MSTRCCDKPGVLVTYAELFCAIDQTLAGCEGLDLDRRLIFESKIPLRKTDGSLEYKNHSKKLDGRLKEIIEAFNRCLNSTIEDDPLKVIGPEDIYNPPPPGSDCSPGPLAGVLQPTPECEEWADLTIELRFDIIQYIESIRSEACHIARKDKQATGKDNLPEPEIRLRTCVHPNPIIASKSPSHIFNPFEQQEPV